MLETNEIVGSVALALVLVVIGIVLWWTREMV